jgi:hypothetical protein
MGFELKPTLMLMLSTKQALYHLSYIPEKGIEPGLLL